MENNLIGHQNNVGTPRGIIETYAPKNMVKYASGDSPSAPQLIPQQDVGMLRGQS